MLQKPESEVEGQDGPEWVAECSCVVQSTVRLSVWGQNVQEANCLVSHMALVAWVLEAVSFGQS